MEKNLQKNKSDSYSKQFWRNFEDWIMYYRLNLHRFIEEFLGIRLNTFQKIAVYLMDAQYTDKINNFLFYCSRGLGKTWLCAVFVCAKCILYPGILVRCASSSVDQAKILIEKIIKLKDTYPMLAQHIVKINFQKDYGKVTFRGGSQIETCVCGPGARGNRANILVLDESRLMFKGDIDQVLIPFLTGSREFPGRHKKVKGYAIKEHNSCIYLTSIGYKNEWSYRILKEYAQYLVKGKMEYQIMDMPYQIGVEAGIITDSYIEMALRNSTEDIATFKQEMCVVPYGTTENSLFDYESLSRARRIRQALYPLSDKDFVLCKGDITKSPYYTPKQPGEIRVLTFDIAYAYGRKNDNSAIGMIRLMEDGDHYIKFISFLEVLNGVSATEQAVRAKQIFYDLEGDYAVVDPGGSGGIAMVSILGQKTVDISRGTRYPAWRTYDYDSKYEQYVHDSNAEAVMYCMASSAANIHATLKSIMDDELKNNRIALLVSDKDIIEDLNRQYDYMKLSTGNYSEREESRNLICSYVNTSAMIDEAINAKMVKTKSGKWTIDEGTGRKDRIISILYGIYFIVNFLEKDLDNKSRKYKIEDYYNISYSNKKLNNPFSNSLEKLGSFGRRR